MLPFTKNLCPADFSEPSYEAVQRASEKTLLKGILRVTQEQLVSRDIIGDPHPSIVDAPSTLMQGRRVAKVLAWCDNEWGYSARVVDFSGFLAERGL